MTINLPSVKASLAATGTNLLCFLAWLMFVIIIGHFPVVIDLLKGVCFRKVFPSVLLIYVVLIASNLYMISSFQKIKAALLLGFSVVAIISLIIVSSMYPFEGEVANFFSSMTVIYYAAMLVSIIGISIVAFLTFIPFREAVQRWKVLSDRDAAVAAVQRQNLGLTDPGSGNW